MIVEVTPDLIAVPRMAQDSPGNPLELALAKALRREGRLQGQITVSTRIAVHAVGKNGSEVWLLPDDAAMLVQAWIRGWPMTAGKYDLGEPLAIVSGRSKKLHKGCNLSGNLSP